MRVGSLFSGAGGLDLAVEAWTGGRTVWQCEQDPDASKVLAARWGVPNLGDITAVDWSQVEPVDVICGGFPCQDISNAGRRAGITGARSGLWSFYADAVRILRPRLVLVENVGALVVRGLDRVICDLAALGYDATWGCVRASDAGAPHRRERLFLVAADAEGDRLERPGGARGRWAGPADGDPPAGGAVKLLPTPTSGDGAGGGRSEWLPRSEKGGSGGLREEIRNPGITATEWGDYEPAIRRWEHLTRPAPEPVDDRGRLSPPFVEWMQGWPKGHVTDLDITRTAQLRILGNGVVPQQAELAFSLLEVVS